MDEIDFLPKRLLDQSLSDREIVLPLDGAKECIEILEKHGFLVLSWEGWLKYSDGAFGHSLRHQGCRDCKRLPDESWEDYTSRSQQYVLKTAAENLAAFLAKPENPGADLYFCLSFLHREDVS